MVRYKFYQSSIEKRLISLEVQKICLQKGDLNNMEKRKDIDMLRFYGGDIHQKIKKGNM